MLWQEVLDSFSSTEFWYVDQGIIVADAEKSALYSKIIQRQEEKWWLPVPRVPSGGLQKDTRKQLTNKRECANQILKAAMAINSITLAEMEVPESYLETLPKVCILIFTGTLNTPYTAQLHDLAEEFLHQYDRY